VNTGAPGEQLSEPVLEQRSPVPESGADAVPEPDADLPPHVERHHDLLECEVKRTHALS